MTTRISEIFDAMDSVLEAQLTNYAKIPNAYDIESNPNLFIQQGYAIGLGPASNTNREVSCKLSVRRTVNVLLAQQITANETDFDAFNLVVKTLFEDQYKIIKAIENDPTLNTNYSVTKFGGDGGSEFGNNGSTKYFMIEMQFDCEYFEDLSP